MIIGVTYTDHPDRYYIYDEASKRLDLVAATYPSIDGQIFASKRKYDYPASDGLRIPGYLQPQRAPTCQTCP